ncbi:M48 family metallopeptidase [soil metagenome]
MKVAGIACIGLLCVCGLCMAQVPETGRWQELVFAPDEVHGQSEVRYLDLLAWLAASGRLDNDRGLLARVKSISAGLIAAAGEMKQETAAWNWEVHVTSDPSVDAICMAGGKILIGSAFVHGLAFDDGELATLIAHEIAHAVAEHQREELSEARQLASHAMPLEVMFERLRSDLSMQIRLRGLSELQEREADQLGMVLAHRAGWPASRMVSFYQKLALSDGATVYSGSHPRVSSRLSMARGMARLLEH